MVDDATGLAGRGRGVIVGHVLGEQQRVGGDPEAVHLIIEELGRTEFGERLHDAPVCLRTV